MALILIEERKIRCDNIKAEDKLFKLSQILRPGSLAVMRKVRNG